MKDRFYKTTLRKLAKLLPQAERLAVLMEQGEGLQVRAVAGAVEDFEAEPSADMVERIVKRRDSALLVDAQQDPACSRDPEVLKRKLRSVLCVKFGTDGVRGVLYADNSSRPAAFSYKHLQSVQKLADEVDPGSFVSGEAPVETVILSENAPAPWLMPVVVVACLIGLLSLFVAPVSSGSKAEVAGDRGAEVEVKPPDLAVRPFGVATVFLNRLREGKLGEARQLLTLSGQASVTVGDLQKAVWNWKALEGPEGMAARRVLEEQVEGATGFVTVGIPGRVGAPVWTWQFVREGGGWKLAPPEGPPFE